jgi:hypothetical protein
VLQKIQDFQYHICNRSAFFQGADSGNRNLQYEKMEHPQSERELEETREQLWEVSLGIGVTVQASWGLPENR